MTAPPAPARRLGRPSDLAVLPLLAVLGVLLALWGALLVPAGPRLAGHVLSVGVVIAVVGNVLFARLGLRASAPFGGLALMVGWTAVALVLGSRRSNGTVVLPGSGDLAVPALVFVLGGLVAGILAAGLRMRR